MCACVFPVPFAFVVLKEDLDDEPPVVLQQLRELVATKIAKYAIPDHFLVKPHPVAHNLLNLLDASEVHEPALI